MSKPNAAILRDQIAARLSPTLRDGWGWRESAPREIVTTGSAALDQIIEGLPRGAITEIVGPCGVGRTSFLLQCLAALTSKGESCAYLDSSDTFDPIAAEAAGVCLPSLLWLRGITNFEKTWKAADLVLQGGGFGVVVLDLGDVPVRDRQRWPISTWHRFRAAVERTPTVLLVVSAEPVAQSTAALRLSVEREQVCWSRRQQVLDRLHFQIAIAKPVRSETMAGHARGWE